MVQGGIRIGHEYSSSSSDNDNGYDDHDVKTMMTLIRMTDRNDYKFYTYMFCYHHHHYQ